MEIHKHKSWKHTNLLENDINDVNGEKLHFNVLQMLIHIIQAQVTAAIIGRAGGKTSRIQVPFSLNNIFKMPRSKGNFVASSHVMILDNLLPEIIAGWESMGYKEDQHFWVRKRPPARLKIEQPFKKIVDYDHAIHWYNGTGINLISFDKNATVNNGRNSDWSMIDECRFLAKDKLDKQLLLTMRGNAEHFGNMSNYLSQMYTTDMPRKSTEMWVFDIAKNMNNQLIDDILIVALQAAKEELKSQKAGNNVHKYDAIRLDKLNDVLNKMRKGSTLFLTGSTIDNIHVLGMDVLENFIKVLDESEVLISVLNNIMIHIEMCFYPPITEDALYDAFDYSYIESKSKETKRDCRYDMDYQKHKPLFMHMDYGYYFNCMLVGQPLHVNNQDQLLCLSEFYSEGSKGEQTKDCVQKFCDYYKTSPCKKVVYFYDHTAKLHTGVTKDSYYDIVMKVLKDNKWEVEGVDTGQTLEQFDRYKIVGDIIRGKGQSLFKVYWNRENTDNCRISIAQTPIKKRGTEYIKDKSSEDPRSGIDQRHATHFGDAADGLLIHTHIYFKKLEAKRRNVLGAVMG